MKQFIRKDRALGQIFQHNNFEFEKAIYLLAHPSALSALVILLINDHLLRQFWPSWFTGKVGDFAWLFFFPYLIAALLAWLLPFRIEKREKFVFGAALTIVGVVFGLMKSLPPVNLMAIRILGILFHTPFSITQDPTDLIALPALAASYFLWRASPVHLPLRYRGIIALPLAALFTLANAGMPDPGVYCFSSQAGSITAQAGYSVYTSQDGGETWTPGPVGFDRACEQKTIANGQWQVVPGPVENNLFRYQPGTEIQEATGSSSTWKTILSLEPVPDAQKQYFMRSRQGYVSYIPGPLDALADPATGNTLFAMGHQGVLVRTAAGTWIWSSVGDYEHINNFPNADAFWLLLGGMLFLSVGLALLLFSSLMVGKAVGTLRILLLATAWIAWLLVDILFPPALAANYTGAISTLGLIGFFILIVPLTIDISIRVGRSHPSLILPAVGLSAAGAVLHFLPYLLWLNGTFPSLVWATGFGLALAVSVLFAGIFILRNKTQLVTGN